MKRTTHSGLGGFVLLEVLPAVLVFSTFLMIGMRMFWMHIRMESETGMRNTVASACMQVWSAWESGGGKAAVVVRRTGSDWEVYDFPDESWLPGDFNADALTRDRDWIIFRRKLTTLEPGRSWWDVEMKTCRAGEDPDWRWQFRIIDQDSGLEDPL